MAWLRYPVTFLILIQIFHADDLAAQQMPEGYRVPVISHALQLTNDTLTFQTIRDHHSGLFHETRLLGQSDPRSTYWFRLDFENTFQHATGIDTIYLVTGVVYWAELYFGDGTKVRVDYTHPARNYHYNHSSMSIPLAVKSLMDSRYLFVKISFNRGRPNLSRYTFRYNTPAAEIVHQNFVHTSALRDQVLVFILIGIAGLLVIFTVLLFYSTRERQYLYYSAFLLFQVIYYSRGSPIVADFLFGERHHLNFLFTEVAQVAANMSYVLFVKHFLDTRVHLPLLNKVLTGVAIALGAFIAIDTVLLLVDPYFAWQSTMMYGQRYVMAAFALLGVVYLVVKAKGNLRLFIIAGTLSYAGGAVTTMLLFKLSYMIIGSMVEIIIFALGLSYKIRSINRDKLRIEREANQVRLSALRAQMNPHFIFNSLNSIQHLISKNDKEGALRYLSRFSIMLRQVLENSINVNIPIKDEIELLRIYLELESLRFDQSFKYHIQVDDNLDVHNLEIPILLLQPYVENAIVHGLLPRKEGPRELNITFTDREKFVLCRIQDTGIGREAAMARKHALKITRPSRGMELNRQRLGLLSNGADLETLVHITDSAEGTLVEINIPKN
jgi:sensor histidine kinase YesM